MKIIHRIKEQDCQQEFSTGKRTFDFDPNGKPVNLRFYFERDRSGIYESYVLVENENVIGILCIRKYKDFLYVSRVGIRKGFWRRGYGTELMNFVILKAIDYGYSKISLEADEESIEFYERLGFKVVRKYLDNYWGSSATMELTLRI